MTEKHKNNNRMLNNSITWHRKKSNKTIQRNTNVH